MFDIVAYYESQDLSTAGLIAAVADQKYKVVNDDIYVKHRAPLLIGWAFLVVSGDVVTQPMGTAEVFSETRQPPMPIHIYHPSVSLTDGTYNRVDSFNDYLERPFSLTPNEKMSCFAQNPVDEIAAAVAFLGDGRFPTDRVGVQPTHQIYMTGSTTLTAGSWTNCTMTEVQSLPEGRYNVIGMKAFSYIITGASPIAARLNLKDSEWRPGVLCERASKSGGITHRGNRWKPYELWPVMGGEAGQSISFEHDQIPDVEFLSASADTAETVYLQLQKIR